MPNFIFTYGSNSKNQPYKGGWTRVTADDAGDAVRAFTAFHPNTKDGLVSCAFIYAEEDFLKTDMAKDHDSFGHNTREIIVVNRNLQQRTSDNCSDVNSFCREILDAS